MTQYDGTLKFDTSLDTSGFSSGISKIGSAATKGLAAAGAALGGMAGYALKVGVDFEAAMSRVAGISGATGEELEKLKDKAKELGASTKFSATEAAEAMENLASAGFTTNEILDAVPGLMDLAAAAGEDLANSADIAASTLRGFGLEASEAGHVADVLAENANRTNAAVADTGEAMKYIAPVANAMGLSMEETAAAVGLLANAGIKGGQAGTTLRSALTRLVKPTEDMEEVMEELGITFFDNEGKMKSLTEIIAILQDSTKDLTDEQKNNALATLFGQEALSGMLALINEGSDALDDLTTAYENCDGAAANTAKTMNDNLKGSVDELNSALEGLGITAYEKFEDPMRNAVDGATDKINDLNKSMSSGKLSKSMDKVATGLGDISEAALDLATDAIPVLVDGFAFVVDHGKEIITTVGSIGAAFAAVKVKNYITPWIQGFQNAQLQLKLFEAAQGTAAIKTAALNGTFTVTETIVGVLTGKITLATAATAAWNMACSALGGPIGIVIAGVGALAGGVIALSLALDNSSNSIINHKEAIDEAKSSHEELEKTKEESITVGQSEANHYDSLKQKLDTLVDANGRVKSGYEGTAEYIVSTLNEALGTNMQIVDGVIQKYDEASSQMDTYIEKMKAQAVLEAQAEALEQAKELYEQNLEEMSSINKDIEDTQEKLNQRMKELRDQGLSDQQINNDASIISNRAFLDHYYQQKQDLQDIQTGILEDKATYYENLSLMQSGSLEDLKKINQSEIAEYDDQRQRITQTLQEQYDQQKLDLEIQKAALEKIDDEAKRKQLQAEIDAGEEKLKQIEQNLKAEKQAIATGKSDIVKKWDQIAEESAKASGNHDEFKKAAEDSVQGYIDGIDENVYRVVSSTNSLALASIAAVKKALDIHSPSGVWENEIAGNEVAGYIQGHKKNEKNVKKSSQKLVKSSYQAAEQVQKKMNMSFVPGQLEQSVSGLKKSAYQLVTDFGGKSSFIPLRNIKTSDKEASTFPKSIEVVGRQTQQIVLMLENGQEIAHWLAPNISKELGIMR